MLPVTYLKKKLRNIKKEQPFFGRSHNFLSTSQLKH